MRNGTRRCSVLGSEIESGVNQLIYMFYDNASLSGLQERVVQCYTLAMLDTTYSTEIGTNVATWSSAAVLHVASAKRGRR